LCELERESERWDALQRKSWVIKEYFF